MVTGDGAYIKKINRSFILQKIMEHDLISRADLSKITGLNKATISVQVADLLEEGLIYETQQEHNTVGRRPIMLSVDPNASYILGIDLDYKQIQFSVSNLKGKIVDTTILHLDFAHNYSQIVALLVENIKSYQKKYATSHYGLVHAIIGVHGTVNKDGSIHFVPTYQWHDVDLKKDLSRELDIEITIENNANLSSVAEKVFHYQEADNMLTIILQSGIGAGVMTNGNLDKGYHGYAGEMGHMILFPGGKQCTCGNLGCWELYAGEPSLFKQLSTELDMPIHTHEDVEELIKDKNPTALKVLKDFISNLSLGINNVINLYNPETVVLNSRILEIHPNAITEIENNLHSNISQYRQIVISKIGRKAAILGACALGIQHFLHISELFLSNQSIEDF